MIDRLGEVRKLPASGLAAADIAARLRAIGDEQQQALAAPEHGSLPRSLTNEVANEVARVSASLADLEQGQSAIARRDALLAEWQGVAPESLNADLLNKAWRQLPPVPEPVAAQLRQRFDELLATIPATVEKPAPAREARKAAPAKPRPPTSSSSTRSRPWKRRCRMARWAPPPIWTRRSRTARPCA
ncbi:hypothetical protein LP420_34715 [Massilia sp. B-10]|nr:hypothetical protein LP420_34715 [Massilia sp. B-10]